MISCGFVILILAMFAALARKAGLFTVLAGLASVVLAFAYAKVLWLGGSGAWSLELPGLVGSADIALDPLSALLGLIFAVGFPIGMIYGYYYLKEHPRPGVASHLFFLALMILSMHCVLIVRNSLLFMVGWELMSLSSFFAMLYDRDSQETVSSAIYYLIMMHIGAAFLLLGFGLIYRQSGILNYSGIEFQGAAKWLLLIGFAFKAGFFPFYSWLPKAHPVAPSHLSGMMSGLMIKTGVFGIVYVLANSSWTMVEVLVLTGVSLITAFNGIIHALAESHLKRSLAWSSIENIGIIGIGLSFWQLGLISSNSTMAALGFSGAMLHLINHSLFKPMLFYLSGNILLATHSLDLNTLGGLDKRMPRTAALFFLGTMAISAMPVMNGFISEFAIFLSVLSGFNASDIGTAITGIVAGAIFAFVSALALIAFSKAYSVAFSGSPRSSHADRASERRTGLLISPILLACLCLGLGIFGRAGLYLVYPLTGLAGIDPNAILSLGHTLDQLSVILLIFITFATVVYLLKRRLGKVSKGPAWGCGYHRPDAKMQYTGTAFIDPLAYFLKPLMHKSSDKSVLTGYFPQELSFEEEVHDYLDSGIFAWLTKGLRWILDLFDRIHNGKINSYITYLLGALIILLIWVLGVLK